MVGKSAFPRTPEAPPRYAPEKVLDTNQVRIAATLALLSIPICSILITLPSKIPQVSNFEQNSFWLSANTRISRSYQRPIEVSYPGQTPSSRSVILGATLIVATLIVEVESY